MTTARETEWSGLGACGRSSPVLKYFPTYVIKSTEEDLWINAHKGNLSQNKEASHLQ